MQIPKLFNRTACLSLALVAFGLAGCAHHEDRTASQSWSDRMTSRHVKSALDDAPTFKYPGVTVSTYDQTVSLGGFVNTEDQKRSAAQIAANVSGVREVINNIVLKPEPTGRTPIYETPTPKLPPRTGAPAQPGTVPQTQPDTTPSTNP